MKATTHVFNDTSTLFVYGSFMISNIDYNGLLDYLIKAILGAVVWFGFKLIQEHHANVLRRRLEQKDKDEQNKPTPQQ